MKKIFLMVAMVGGFAAASFANDSYKVNDATVDQMFAQSTDITFAGVSDNEMISTMTNSGSAFIGGGEKTKGGYFLRLIFCGIIGLHRSYMGTGGKSVWCYYLIPCYNTLLFIGDFWVVLFKNGQFEKYKNNSHVNVWMAK